MSLTFIILEFASANEFLLDEILLFFALSMELTTEFSYPEDDLSYIVT